MVAVKVFFAFLIVLFISAKGFACDLSSITVNIAKTGRFVKGQPEFEVTVSNNCICTQYNIMVNCDGFKSVEPVDPAIMVKYESGECMLNNRQPLHQDETLKFKFAGQAPSKLTPISANIACS